mgnify:CR=1 FL=1
MTIETLFKNLKKAVAYQERENSSFYEELGKRIKGYFLNCIFRLIPVHRFR